MPFAGSVFGEIGAEAWRWVDELLRDAQEQGLLSRGVAGMRDVPRTCRYWQRRLSVSLSRWVADSVVRRRAAAIAGEGGVRQRVAGGSASAAAARLPAPGVLAYADEEPVSCEADAEAEVFLAIGTGDHRWAGGGW